MFVLCIVLGALGLTDSPSDAQTMQLLRAGSHFRPSYVLGRLLLKYYCFHSCAVFVCVQGTTLDHRRI